MDSKTSKRTASPDPGMEVDKLHRYDLYLECVPANI